jgi:DNA helicase-2/ATP-dependent DNA helicase PcrA
MSSDQDREQILDFERAVNERYGRSVQDLLRSDVHEVAKITGLSRNSQWISGSATTPRVTGSSYVVSGRVSLNQDDEYLGNSFYIGATYHVIDGTVVVNWNAPIAELFFLGRESNDVLAESVIGRRSFHVANDDITAFFDEIEASTDPNKAFPLTLQRALHIPKPPRTARPIIAAMKSFIQSKEKISIDFAAAPPSAKEEESVLQEEPTPTDSSDHISNLPPTPVPMAEEVPVIRSMDAVVHALNQPRKGKLTAVLATLQPDQYKLVTWPSKMPLIVQGQPGTGKTIIALHRAAFLTHSESEFKDASYGPLHLKRVALIGPTEIYSNHVRHIHSELGSSGIEIMSVESLLRSIIGVTEIPKEPTGTNHEYLETRWEFGNVATKSVDWWRKHQPGRPVVAEHIINALTKPSPLRAEVLGGSLEYAELFNDMRDWNHAVKNTNYWPFISMINLHAKKPTGEKLFDHIFVDEAQDIDPLRWRIIDNYLKPGANFSIFGDMNQRRSNFSYDTWTKLATDLQLTDENGLPPVRELKTIYRSTRQILVFASRLLPKSERRILALREGLPPRIVKVGSVDLVRETAKQINDLVVQFPTAINAVITLNEIKTRDELRRSGWTYDGRDNILMRDDFRIRVLRPEEARGLEFDGVVVVEPSKFPENVGRQGVLYTSLTRANQELIVVHSEALPLQLQNRSNRH